jgi:hypothetical protein
LPLTEIGDENMYDVFREMSSKGLTKNEEAFMGRIYPAPSA